MATGKELVRMMTCGIWKDFVESKPYFRYAQIYDHDGNKISLKEANSKTFCHARILLRDKDLTGEYVQLLGAMLRLVASTSSEMMDLHIDGTYGIYEIIIS